VMAGREAAIGREKDRCRSRSEGHEREGGQEYAANP
jgi:hypothetical protein